MRSETRTKGVILLDALQGCRLPKNKGREFVVV
jgi:hypothetical protein